MANSVSGGASPGGAGDGPGMAFDLLGAEIAQEVLKEYADLLRVGRLTVNGVIVRWRVHGNNARALDCFLSAFKARVNMIFPDLEDWGMFAYTVLKAISINFALYEVTEYIRNDIGTDNMITILTYDSASKQQVLHYAVELYYADEDASKRAALARTSLASFALDHDQSPKKPDSEIGTKICPIARNEQTKDAIGGGWVVGVIIDFLRSDNILECDKKGKPRVRGTMRTIRAAFPYPAPPHFRPSYEVECDLKRRWGKRLLFSRKQSGIAVNCSNELGPSQQATPRPVAASNATIGREPSNTNSGRAAAFNRAAGKLLHWVPFSRKGKEFADLTAGIKEQILGELVLEILHAEGLQSIGVCNPFVVVTLGSDRRNTSVVRGTSKPEWKNTFRLQINRFNSRTSIDMTAWNTDAKSPTLSAIENSEFLGQAFLDVDQGMDCTAPTVMRLSLKGIDSAAKHIMEEPTQVHIMPEGTDATAFCKSPTARTGSDRDSLRSSIECSVAAPDSPDQSPSAPIPVHPKSPSRPQMGRKQSPNNTIVRPSPGASASNGNGGYADRNINKCLEVDEIEHVVKSRDSMQERSASEEKSPDLLPGVDARTELQRAGAHEDFEHKILPVPYIYIRCHFKPASPNQEGVDIPTAVAPQLPIAAATRSAVRFSILD